MKCPICGRGELFQETKSTIYEYRKHRIEIDSTVETCPECQESFVINHEVKTLGDVLKKFKKDVDKMIGESNKLEWIEKP
jgi:YgiT-type zinc finger domain-containing protein